MRGARTCATVALVAVAVVGCGDRNQAAIAPGNAGYMPGPLNDVSAAEVLAAIDNAHLPALNRHDATGSLCATAGCLEAEVTDTVSILKFPAPDAPNCTPLRFPT